MRTEEKVFERAIDNRRDVTDTFCADFGFDSTKSTLMIESEVTLRRRLREQMECGQGGGRLFVLKQEASPFLQQAQMLLDQGRVGAVDGTTALAKIDFMNTTQYACAIGWLTSRRRGDPHIIVTETSSAYIDPEHIRTASGQDLATICEELDEARASETWPTAFREYEERRIAITHCDADCVFIDGPIFTSNLISQTIGRDLLSDLISSPKIYVGIIKRLSVSWALGRWYASALRSGEGYLICPIGEMIKQRLSTPQTEMTAWLTRAESFWRVVFRPAEKAFAFECRVDQVGLACALLQLDASPTLQHELPLLLETIDAQLRAGFSSDLARSAVLNRIMIEKDGYRPAIDAIDEREFR